MMGKRDLSKRVKNKRINLEFMVPRNHIIRKIDRAIDLSFIYDEVQELYSPLGKTSIDPVVLFKIVIIQYFFGIRSMRQTIKEIEVKFVSDAVLPKRRLVSKPRTNSPKRNTANMSEREPGGK